MISIEANSRIIVKLDTEKKVNEHEVLFKIEQALNAIETLPVGEDLVAHIRVHISSPAGGPL